MNWLYLELVGFLTVYSKIGLFQENFEKNKKIQRKN
jgi:hypothetical protein